MRTFRFATTTLLCVALAGHLARSQDPLDEPQVHETNPNGASNEQEPQEGKTVQAQPANAPSNQKGAKVERADENAEPEMQLPVELAIHPDAPQQKLIDVLGELGSVEVQAVTFTGRAYNVILAINVSDETPQDEITRLLERLTKESIEVLGINVRPQRKRPKDAAGQMANNRQRLGTRGENKPQTMTPGGWKRALVFPNPYLNPLAAEGDPAPPSQNYVASGNIIISIAEDNRTVWGFSKTKGEWAKQPIESTSEDELQPICGNDVAGLRVDNAIYGFSGETGRWDVLRLPADCKPQMSVDPDMLLVTDERSIYIFANSTGRWSSRDSAKAEAPQETGGDESLKIFSLKHLDAISATEILSQLFEHATIASDERTNALIVRAESEQTVLEIEALLMRLDQAQHDRQPAKSLDLTATVRGGPRGNTRFDPAGVRETYRRLEENAAQLAAQYRSLILSASRPLSDAERQELSGIVEQAFEARQQLQRAELTQLRQRLVRIEQQIEAREGIKDVVIERRVEELLDPALQWHGDTR